MIRVCSAVAFAFVVVAASCAVAQDLYALRGGLDNSRLVFEKSRQGRVAFIGGSITASPGWRDLTGDMLKKRFPDTAFDFINAGVGGTNSTYGAFRFEQDVLAKGPVDLLFLEFAVNDDGDPVPGNRYPLAMEGIIRHARSSNPKMDIIVLYFADQGKVDTYRKGETPKVILEHEKVVEHYGIPSLQLAREVTRRLDAGEFQWAEFSRDTCHPLDRGHAIYAECIGKLFDEAWAQKLAPDAELGVREMPAPLDPMNYEHGRFIPLDQAKVVRGWKRIPQWDTEKKCNYGGAVDVLAAEAPGDAFELEFEGSLVGISAIAGMDAGTIEVSIDGGAAQRRDLFDGYCLQFHRPVCHVLAENLPAGKHVLRLTISSEHNAQSQGYAARVLKFVAS